MRYQFMIVACASSLIASGASAATPGVVETFQSGLNGWGSNPSIITLEAANGADGPGDAFASIESQDVPTELLIRTSASSAPAFTGDFVTAGITQIAFDLNELATDDGLGIRIGIGQVGNFWISDQVFDPQADTWETFTVDLIESNFTEVFGGGGTWAAVINNVQRVQFRHDLGAANIMPEPIDGKFGIDNITLIPTPGTAGVLSIAGLAMMRRRR